MTVFDELAETDGDEEFKAWVSDVYDAKQKIIDFVSSRGKVIRLGSSMAISRVLST